MLTFTKRKGRAGNRLFQLASMIGLAETYGHELRLPKAETWDLLKYFDLDIPEFTGMVHKNVVEPNYHYDPEFWQKELLDTSKTIDICGWLQTDKYFTKKLRFKTDYKNRIWAEHGFNKPTIAISVRRGDFVDNPNYYQLPIKYYIGALLENFPNWRECDLVFFSDDPEYIKIHFQCLPNAHFPKLSPMEQLCLGSQCDNFIVSNSTFSWWMAYLSENENKKIVRPLKNLAGQLEKTHDEKDYWPESWQIFNHEKYRINLSNTTFVLPVHYDHLDRKQNLDLCICMLQRDFDTRIIIMEQGSDKFPYHSQWSTFIRSNLKEFHRTKMLNDMVNLSETPYIVLHDADVFIPPMQLVESVNKLDQGADMVYPYDGRFARVPRKRNFELLEKNLDVGVLQGDYARMNIYESVGGSIFYNKDSFIEGGMENENFIAHAPEDAERWDRFNKLGFKVERVNGRLYHLDHYVGQNSSTTRNPHYKNNFDELEKIRSLSKEQLKDYIDTWSWRHPYTKAYYDSIIEQSVKSRDNVISQLLWNYRFEVKNIIDVGCGIGEWGNGIEKFGVEKYVGIDYGIPKDKLLIENYYECDLKTVGTVTGVADSFLNRFDLCLCLEVAEHLPEDVAPDLINFLCSLSDYILFSAAIPYQPGVGHINCQWQTWWEKLFNENGYYVSEQPIKDLLINNPNVADWYKQNMVLYSKQFKGKAEDFVLPKMFTDIINSFKQIA